MRKLSLFILLTASIAGAQTIPTTPNLHLPLIPDGYQNWGVPYRSTMNILDTWSTTVALSNNPIFTGTVTFPTSFNGCLSAASGVISATGTACPTNPVTTVFGRVGPAITAQSGDYSFSLISGTIAATQLPNATTSALGGVKCDGTSITCTNGVIATVGGTVMVYPAAGIAVSTGSAWTTSLTAPSGTIVGTTDTQTLTNKTVDGVSPATFAFLDPTSSVQTQLNTKSPSASPTFTGTITLPFTGSTQCLHVNSAGVLSGTGSDCGSGGGGGSPGGSNGQIQYNNSGSFGGDVVTTDGAGNWSGLASVSVSGTGGSVLASGVIDGHTPVEITTSTSVSVGSSTSGPCNPSACLGEYIFNNATSTTTYTLPVAEAGRQYCFRNATGKTNILVIATSGSGQFIDNQGVNTTSGGNITSSGALGDSVCLVGASPTQWYSLIQSGTFTTN